MQYDEIKIHGVEFHWEKLTLILHTKPRIEINGKQTDLDASDWEELRYFGPDPDRFGNICQPSNATLFYWLEDRIFNESDGEVVLKEFTDYSRKRIPAAGVTDGPVLRIARQRSFLVWNRAARPSAIPLLDYISDAIQDVMDRYQFPGSKVAETLQWHAIDVPAL